MARSTTQVSVYKSWRRSTHRPYSPVTPTTNEPMAPRRDRRSTVEPESMALVDGHAGRHAGARPGGGRHEGRRRAVRAHAAAVTAVGARMMVLYAQWGRGQWTAAAGGAPKKEAVDLRCSLPMAQRRKIPWCSWRSRFALGIPLVPRGLLRLYCNAG